MREVREVREVRQQARLDHRRQWEEGEQDSATLRRALRRDLVLAGRARADVGEDGGALVRAPFVVEHDGQ